MAALSFISASKLAELLNVVDGRRNMFVRIISANRLALGVDPLQPTLSLDLSEEKIGPYNQHGSFGVRIQSAEEQTLPVTDQPSMKVSRRSGEHWFKIDGHKVTCRSLKELLPQSLREIEKRVPGTLEKLSNVKPRSRRIVARDPSRLFDKQHLTKKYAEQFLPGWWCGTNNNAEQVEVWLKRACELAELQWKSDFEMHSSGRQPVEGLEL